ncbi:Trx7/PDZ domain-containing (seleno)protein [Paludisphaera rhizosphaerae]|uniref:Trx7/PDZ domain-containing (seleno)protein n=1 Tax=Paludisphaera rhizosphaerae TaxID=2711216 RepID=UPI0013EB5FF3|nr:Trx7/PDZ domain-containing (seleno)protein [Paludisphaera rhizosphaerae]
MRSWMALIGVLLLTYPADAQDRDTKVRNDRASFVGSREWIYNDLADGAKVAKEADRPLLVVFRCIPCVACQKFDDDVARRDPIIRDLLDEFVCVRIVQANVVDLTLFQHDFDQSFAAYLMAPDLTIYGRYGTRSKRPEYEDISLEGLRKAMEAALRLHKQGAAAKASLAGKQVKQERYKTPRDYPALSGRYGERIDYEGKTAQSCMHCHQIREAERLVYRASKEPIPDAVLFPYPDPAVLGLKMDPRGMALVEQVEPGSIAERAGVKVGDEFATLAGQPMLSIADIQWVLHNTPDRAKIPATITRGGKTTDATLDLPEGWRRADVSWRVTTWDLRRMGLGGLKLAELDAADRERAKLPADAMALRVEHVGQYGEHAAAKKAGFQKGDVLVSFDGRTAKSSETDLIAHAVQQKKAGDEVAVVVLRNGERMTLKLPLQ